MAERKDESEDEALRARLDKLSSALDAHGLKPDGPKAEQESGSIGTAMSLGFRVLTEFAAAVVVGALIGWQLDVWLHTSPLLLIIFLAFGTAAGFWNVYRIAVEPTGSKGRPG
ncbi:MAG TPA: AtpZ/AtpI family protein [Beijerinckia sp.]|nr:AtpZ/AtpI family protein [Beijerinckia sp.]